MEVNSFFPPCCILGNEGLYELNRNVAFIAFYKLLESDNVSFELDWIEV